jgi:hypothetical protein
MADGSSICAACGHGMRSSQKVASGFKQPRQAPRLQRSTVIALIVGASLSLLWLCLFLAGKSNFAAAIGFIIVFCISALACGLWILFAAGRRGVLTAAACLIVPLYAFYFVFGVHRGKALMTATAQYIVGAILLLVLVNSSDFERRMSKIEADAHEKIAAFNSPGGSSTYIIAQQPNLPPPQTLAPGVLFHEVTLDCQGPSKVVGVSAGAPQHIQTAMRVHRARRHTTVPRKFAERGRPA